MHAGTLLKGFVDGVLQELGVDGLRCKSHYQNSLCSLKLEGDGKRFESGNHSCKPLQEVHSIGHSKTQSALASFL